MEGKLDLAIREKLVEYLTSRMTLDVFKQWFLSTTWDVEETANKPLCSLIAEIHLRLAEFSEGHWTEPEMREIFAPMTQSYKVSISYGTQSSTTQLVYRSTASETLRPSVGIEFVAASW